MPDPQLPVDDHALDSYTAETSELVRIHFIPFLPETGKQILTCYLTWPLLSAGNTGTGSRSSTSSRIFLDAYILPPAQTYAKAN